MMLPSKDRRPFAGKVHELKKKHLNNMVMDGKLPLRPGHLTACLSQHGLHDVQHAFKSELSQITKPSSVCKPQCVCWSVHNQYILYACMKHSFCAGAVYMLTA